LRQLESRRLLIAKKLQVRSPQVRKRRSNLLKFELVKIKLSD